MAGVGGHVVPPTRPTLKVLKYVEHYVACVALRCSGGVFLPQNRTIVTMSHDQQWRPTAEYHDSSDFLRILYFCLGSSIFFRKVARGQRSTSLHFEDVISSPGICCRSLGFGTVWGGRGAPVELEDDKHAPDSGHLTA